MVLRAGLCWARVGAGVGVVIDAGVGVGGHRIGVEDGVGPAAPPGGVAGGLQLLTCSLGLLTLQLQLHLQLLQLRGRGPRAELAPRRTPHPRQLGQQLWRTGTERVPLVQMNGGSTLFLGPLSGSGS